MAFNNKGKIYKIYSLNGDEVYIGCTMRSLESRIQKHYKAYSEYLKGSRGNHESFKVFDLYGNDTMIQLIKEFKHITEEDLKMKKDAYVKTHNHKEYQRQEYHRQYYHNNIERIKAYDKDYYQKNIEKIKQRYKQSWICDVCNVELKKWGYQRHLNSAKHQRNEENNGAKPNPDIIKCICNCIVVRKNLPRHLLTKKHIQMLEQQ